VDIDEKMSLAVEHARVALQNSEMPIAAIVFLDNKVVAKAYTTEKMEKRYLVHAELNALIDADKRGYAISERKKMQLFTTLEPCLMCFGAAKSPDRF
jgi:tRNA(adenine34) deaminase